MEIGFNVKYLLDFLKSVAAEKITFNYTQEQKPVVLQEYGNSDYLYIVMPIKLA